MAEGAIYGNLAPFESAVPKRFISGFWRRVFALLIDATVTAIPCALLVGLCYILRIEAGGWLEPLGLVITLAYFGILGSEIGNGQTLGHRWTGIEVVDAQGEHLSPGRSLLRYAIFLIPLSGINFPVWIVWVGIVAVLATVYLYLFNTRTRQTLHDVITASFVVESPGAGVVDARLWRGHWVVLSVLLAIMLAVNVLVYRSPSFQELKAIQRALQDSDDFRVVQVRVTMPSSRTAELQLTLAWRHEPANYEEAAAGVVAMVERADLQAAKKDFISIRFQEGLHFGLANFSTTKTFRYSPRQWEEINRRRWAEAKER